MKRILFGAYPWAFDCPGGGERQLMAYRTNLEGQGVRVGLYDQWQPVGADWQIFHFFSVMPGSIQLCNYIRNKGLKLVVSPNLWVTPETCWNYPHEDICRLVEVADLLVVNSKLEASALGEVYGVPFEKFHVVYNGVERCFFEPADPNVFRMWAGIGSRRYLLNVANIEARKNQLAFLEALRDFPDLCLVVVGHARDVAYLHECREKGGDQFIHVGPLEYGSPLLRSAMNGAEAFVMPSMLETPSIAALEAGAAGCRVLVTSVGSTFEYFGDGATYIDPGSVTSMRDGVRRVLKSPNGGLREQVMKKFTWDVVLQELLKAYDRVLREER